MLGYYRFPTIHEETVVFVCEDDLWTVPLTGGVARRLTTSLGAVGNPCFSPDGSMLAFGGREEGPWELYCMPAVGGEATRLTFQDGMAGVACWTPDGTRIVYSSKAGQPFWGMRWLWSISSKGGSPEHLDYGVANDISFGPSGKVVLGRCTSDPARWKRYRGGTAGQLWIDREGEGNFSRLLPADGNFSAPMWIRERVYFVSDHEGIGNLYSCRPSGKDLIRHTHSEEYYIRAPRTDGKRIVYTAGADLYAYDIKGDATSRIHVELRSPRVQRQRKFVPPARDLNEYALHPDGHALALTVRGGLFTMANWEGAVCRHGEREGARHRLAQWLHDGKRLVAISDVDGEEAIEMHARDGSARPVRLSKLDIGRPLYMQMSPVRDEILLLNNRCELLVVDLKKRKLRRIDKSDHHRVLGASWSPDGRWIAYALAATERTSAIMICDVKTGKKWTVTTPEFLDVTPEWDPEGNYLYFISYRGLNPVYDDVHFDVGFPQAARLLLVTLRRDLPNPFVPQPRPFTAPKAPEANGEKAESGKKEKAKRIAIDFDNIEQRVVSFPYPEGIYAYLAGIEGKVLFSSFPIEGVLDWKPLNDEGPKGVLQMYDLKEQKKDTLVTGVSSFDVSLDRKTLAYRAKDRLRVIKAGEKPPEKDGDPQKPSRQTGWIDLNRIKASVIPGAEWRQMYRETWRLQRDHFWTEDMSGVEWEKVYKRYLPLLDRVATRWEFSDLMWEMQGELGTSHAYEFGGDYRFGPNYAQGFLGADLVYDAKAGGYRILHIVRGDAWEQDGDSPFSKPGVNIGEGDVLLAIGGEKLTRDRAPGQLLVNLARQEIEVTVRDRKTGKTRTATVGALGDEQRLRYREWVNRNRDYVHKKTRGQAGYVHIPNMMGHGYAEFHRGWLAELGKPGLIVDVRYNGGGHVSPLILEKLARRRIGYVIRRWGTPIPYPQDAVMGPIVALTNECAGSDGDIFSHCFKLMKLGKLIGKRTWGGVIGITLNSIFVDGGMTTQPEFSFWFEDVGWGVENYGTDPDIEVDYRPQDYRRGEDPQLDRAIREIIAEMKEKPPRLPDFGKRPRRSLPKLPRTRS